MTQTICLDKKKFQKIENEILKDVLNTSKFMIETFKFRMIYGTKIKPQVMKKVQVGLNEFRNKNWNKKLNRNQAYKEYLGLY